MMKYQSCLHKRVEVNGHELFFFIPQTTREVLVWSVEICGPAIHDGALSPSAVAAMARWLSNYADGWEAAEFLRDFETEHLVELGNAVVQSASLAPDVLAGVRQALQVSTKATDYDSELAERPCECLACTGKEDTDDRCLFANVPPFSMTLVGLRRLAESPELLDAPWWVYQLRVQLDEAVALGMAGARQGAERERRGQERSKEIRKNILGSVSW